MSLNYSTIREYTIFFDRVIEGYNSNYREPHIRITIYHCPNDGCNRHTVFAVGKENSDFDGLNSPIWPPYTCNYYPDYVPQYIQQDYQEACAVTNISPKASATLSRRCLQGMIRDFHEITKANLHQEIHALKGKLDDEVIDALLALKSVGNIGAHPKVDARLMVDVEPDEAAELISLIEYLIEDWYVAREKRKGLINRLKSIGDQKDIEKKPASKAAD